MGLVEVIFIAVGLSMDAFAVSITLGLSVKRSTLKEMLIPGLFFGFFQALMPTIGYFAGIYFVNKIQNIDHWLAFALLGFIAGKLIKESLSKENESKKSTENPFQFVKMLVLAIATSIDALAIGITFAIFKVNIIQSVIITGFTTFFIAMGGVKIGNIFGMKFRSKAEFLGGAVLLLLGIKIVIEHQFFNAG